MPEPFRLAVAQLDTTVGDLRGNLDRIRAARAEAARLGADLVVTPEHGIAGYPPEDLVRKPAFVADAEAAIAALAAETGTGPALIVGGPWADGPRLHNAAYVLDGGEILARVPKHELPNYGVFDDKRVFDPGASPGPVVVRGVRLGVMVCEDWWLPAVPARLAEAGAEMLLSINASPHEAGKQEERLALALARVMETRLPFVFANQVGGQDELVFDGASFVLNADRALALRLPAFEETVALTEWRRESAGLVCAGRAIPPPEDPLALTYRALMRGLADYVRKNRFPGIILGLSGGIDSALSAAIAVDALGAGTVRAFMLPSPYTSRTSLDDAASCAALLGIRHDVVPITPAMTAFDTALAPLFAGRPADTTEENIQSRIRGTTLMAISNKLGAMLLTTGNKSEMSTGYATLYGDMCGGYSVLKDVYKTEVFALSRFRNAHRPAGARGPAGPVMPDRVITKPPSAELKHDQTDQDTLPPYDELDAILAGLIEGERGVDALAAEGHDRATVLRVWRMLDRAEYKRRQAPPGVKITRRAFGRDRRYPITNGYTDLVR